MSPSPPLPPPAPAPRDAGEPLLECFECGRACTLGQLTLYPWWDEHARVFDSMYWCRRCVPKVHKALDRSLRRDAGLVPGFLAFARQRVRPAPAADLGATPAEQLTESLRVLDALRSGGALVARRGL